MQMIRIIMLALLTCFSSTTTAIKVSGLYEVEIPVADQSEAARADGLQTAFRRVLIKLTGDRQAAGRPSIRPLFNRTRDYLQQYRYREAIVEHTTAEGEVIRSPETRLWVKFDEDNLNNALRGLGIPVWGWERPSTLVWLAISDPDGRRLLGLEDGAEFIEVLELRARQRGIALLHPLLDLDDSNRLRASDLWGGFREPVLEASSRYQADTVLAVTLESPVPGIWEANWTVYLDGQMARWNSESDLVEAVLDEGIDNLADVLAAQYTPAVAVDGINRVRLSVSDIFSVDQYAKVLSYLGSLNSVSDVEVEQVESGRVIFILEAHGGQLAINQAIELGRILEPITSQGTDYRLLP